MMGSGDQSQIENGKAMNKTVLQIAACVHVILGVCGTILLLGSTEPGHRIVGIGVLILTFAGLAYMAAKISRLAVLALRTQPSRGLPF